MVDIQVHAESYQHLTQIDVILVSEHHTFHKKSVSSRTDGCQQVRSEVAVYSIDRLVLSPSGRRDPCYPHLSPETKEPLTRQQTWLFGTRVKQPSMTMNQNKLIPRLQLLSVPY
ncbi:unnamed protein product [Arctogadus glacialis]